MLERAELDAFLCRDLDLPRVHWLFVRVLLRVLVVVGQLDLELALGRCR